MPSPCHYYYAFHYADDHYIITPKLRRAIYAAAIIDYLRHARAWLLRFSGKLFFIFLSAPRHAAAARRATPL